MYWLESFPVTFMQTSDDWTLFVLEWRSTCTMLDRFFYYLPSVYPATDSIEFRMVFVVTLNLLSWHWMDGTEGGGRRGNMRIYCVARGFHETSGCLKVDSGTGLCTCHKIYHCGCHLVEVNINSCTFCLVGKNSLNCVLVPTFSWRVVPLEVLHCRRKW